MTKPQPKGETMTATDTEASTAPEPVSAELVRTDDDIDRRQRDDVERFAEHALAMPGSASYEEFKTLCLQAKLLSMSGAAPKQIKDNPHVAIHIVLIGRDLGISASAAVELIDVIETQQGLRPSLSPQLINGQIRRLGLGSIVKAIDDDEHCVAVALAPGGRVDRRCAKAGTYPEHWYDQSKYDDMPYERKTCTCTPELWIGDTEFTWQDAQLAGLAGPNCTPGAHDLKEVQNKGLRCPCNFGYLKYWPRMRWWRASGFCADDWFPEAGLGLYTAEELGAYVDANGRAIDVDSVELPEGYEPRKGMAGYVVPPAELSEDERALRVELQLRVLALPEVAQYEYRKRKNASDKLRGVATYQMDSPQLRLTNSILGGVEAFARSETAKTGTPWDADAALARVHAQLVSVIMRLFCVITAGDAESVGDETTSETASGDEPSAEASNPEPQQRRSRAAKKDPEPLDEQTDALAGVVTAMAAHASKLSEIIDSVTKMTPSEVGHLLESDRFMVKASTLPNDDSRKQRLVVELCREYLAERPHAQPTLDEA